MTKPEIKYNNSVTVSVIKHNPDYSKVFTWIFLYIFKHHFSIDKNSILNTLRHLMNFDFRTVNLKSRNVGMKSQGRECEFLISFFFSFCNVTLLPLCKHTDLSCEKFEIREESTPGWVTLPQPYPILFAHHFIFCIKQFDPASGRVKRFYQNLSTRFYCVG